MKKILITDDQLEVRDLVEVTLSGKDTVIFKASNGSDAVKIASEEKPDLILMDIMMPGGINGFEATRLIKSNPDTASCVIIILSAKGQQVDMDRGKEAGADYYFVKPFSPLDLIKKVEEITEQAGIRQE